MKTLILSVLLFFFSSCFADCELCPSAKVIFVNNSNAITGSGTYANPYNDLKFALNPLRSGPCDVIYVFPGNMTYDAGNTPFVLQNNQRLLSTTREAYQRCPISCDIPTLTATNSSLGVIQLANNNEVSGFNIVTDRNVSNTYGIRGNGDIFRITNALITNNNFTTYNGGTCVGAENCPHLGTFVVKNCAFYAGDNENDRQTWGIQIFFSGNAEFQVEDSFFAGTNETNGFFLPIASIIFSGDIQYSIQRNTVICSSRSVAGIGIDSVFPPGTGNQTGTINDNFVEMPSEGLSNHAGGIACINRTTSNFYRFTITNNVSITPPSVPGYLIWNTSMNIFYLDLDNSNVGTITINTPNPIVSPGPDVFTPVIWTPL